MSAPTHKASATIAALAMIVNAGLLGALGVLSFDPQRKAFGRATGLWHACRASATSGTGYERWSPLLFVLLIPAVVGVVAAASLPRPARTGLKVLSVLLGIAAIGAVVVPTGSCIA